MSAEEGEADLIDAHLKIGDVDKGERDRAIFAGSANINPVFRPARPR